MKLAFEIEVPDGAIDQSAEAELLHRGTQQAMDPVSLGVVSDSAS